jgi:hypothetical protein
MQRLQHGRIAVFTNPYLLIVIHTLNDTRVFSVLEEVLGNLLVFPLG